MFDTSYKARKKAENELKRKCRKVRSSQLYCGTDIGYRGPGSFYDEFGRYEVVPVWKLYVDHFGTGGSVELSHREGRGYSVVTSVSVYKPQSHLDFSFIKPEDIIDLKINSNISKIRLNSVNMRYAFFKVDDLSFDVDYDINIDTSLIETLISLNKFISNNQDTIASINFTNNDPIMASFISKICMMQNISDISFNREEKVMKK